MQVCPSEHESVMCTSEAWSRAKYPRTVLISLTIQQDMNEHHKQKHNARAQTQAPDPPRLHAAEVRHRRLEDGIRVRRAEACDAAVAPAVVELVTVLRDVRGEDERRVRVCDQLPRTPGPERERARHTGPGPAQRRTGTTLGGRQEGLGGEVETVGRRVGVVGEDAGREQQEQGECGGAGVEDEHTRRAAESLG